MSRARQHRPAAFSVAYEHAGFGTSHVFMTFTRSEKLQAFECLRRLSRAWPRTTYRLKRENKTIARIEVGEIHFPRGHATRRAREKFRAECAAADLAFGIGAGS